MSSLMKSNNRILSLDPSSTSTGYALLSDDGQLCEAGLLKPDRSKDPAHERIGAMCRDLSTVLKVLHPGEIVIEWTSGKVGKKRHKGSGAGLAIYGAAVGAIWRTCEIWMQKNHKKSAVLLFENEWTRGRTKAGRIKDIIVQYPQYNYEIDPGGDVADAIGLASHFLTTRKIMG